MPVDIFTRQQFEDALPVNSKTRQPIWRPLGIVDGEYAYIIPVKETGIGVHIRSSIGRSGTSAGCGEDSIRAWLVDEGTGQPWGSKISRWTTRVPGWAARMVEVFGKLWDMALLTHDCSVCKEKNGVGPRMKIFITKSGPNKGGLFLKCAACGKYEWLGKDE